VVTRNIKNMAAPPLANSPQVTPARRGKEGLGRMQTMGREGCFIVCECPKLSGIHVETSKLQLLSCCMRMMYSLILNFDNFTAPVVK